MSGRGGKALTVMAAVAISWYTGVKFWQPLVVEQLKKDGNLRDDIEVNVTDDQPNSWQDVKDKLRETLHPGVDFAQGTNAQVVEGVKVDTPSETPSEKK